jgi:hypothetical protein
MKHDLVLFRWQISKSKLHIDGQLKVNVEIVNLI